MSKNTNQTPDKATLIIGEQKFEFPIYHGTEGPSVIDIQKLISQTGYLTYDPGFTSTASCSSAVTFIDGDEGRLLYRGYPIEQLAEHSDFLEICYLLMHGELPKLSQRAQFSEHITYHTLLHEQIISFFSGFRRDAHPMAVMVGVVGALSAFYHDSLDIHDTQARDTATYRLIAKMPTLAAMAYKYTIGQPFVYPINSISYAGNLLRMMFAVPTEEYIINPIFEKALDLILILHADHEQNASTSTVRLAGSSAANPFACVASGIAALWGPAHGGANEAVLKMLHEIGHAGNIPLYLEKAKDKNDPFRLMGFGHRVYKNFDPRATLMREMCHKVLDQLGQQDDPLFELALELEAIALKDEYFVSRKLYPNVDFYSGIILKAMKIPTSMFTVIFSVARTIGWVTHWREMISDPNQKIGRPRQLYSGNAERNFVPMQNRK